MPHPKNFSPFEVADFRVSGRFQLLPGPACLGAAGAKRRAPPLL